MPVYLLFLFSLLIKGEKHVNACKKVLWFFGFCFVVVVVFWGVGRFSPCCYLNGSLFIICVCSD